MATTDASFWNPKEKSFKVRLIVSVLADIFSNTILGRIME